MQPPVVAAIIAGAVSLVAAVVSVFSARWTLASARERLRAEEDALRQNVLTEVLDRRMNAYAALWSVMISHGLNWRLEGKPVDASWADGFLEDLNACNAAHGAFFSQAVYEKFFAYRSCLLEIRRRAGSGEPLGERDLLVLEAIASGVDGQPGLGTVIKDDLGSYVHPITRAALRSP
jgi:hypothetical protein